MGYKRNDWKFLEGINKKIETFYPFPKEIRSGTRTSSLSGKIKRKERLPDESVLDRYVCAVCCRENQKYEDRVHPIFGQARSE